MTIQERGRGNPGVTNRLARGAVPIVIVCLLFWGLAMEHLPGPMALFAVFAACGIVLWFGWSSIRRNIATKWFGVLLALYIGLVLGLYLLGIAVGVSLALFPLFLLALPLLVYDLLFRAPFEGRFTRAR